MHPIARAARHCIDETGRSHLSVELPIVCGRLSLWDIRTCTLKRGAARRNEDSREGCT